MYKIKGADGKDYGPIDANQIRQWIAEGRINAQTLVLAEGATEWRAISEFAEFASSFPTLPPPGAVPAGVMPAASPAAQEMVNGPATGLMVVAILSLVLIIAQLVMRALGVNFMSGRQMEQPEFARFMSGAGAVVGAIIGFAIYGLVLAGAVKMKKLESYGLAMTASILALLPCSLCCIAGLPIGIWSLVVLSKPEVKSAFH